MDSVRANQMTDEELVEQTVHCPDDFGYLIRRYQDKLLRYILRLSNIRIEDAEDLLQEIFIKVYRNLNGFDRSLSFSSWIYRITHNHVISYYRKQKARPEGNLKGLQETEWNQLTSGLDLRKELDQKDRREQIMSILNTMDEKYREVLFLKFLEEKDYQELSDILEKPMGTVGTLINRAKKQFQKAAHESRIDFSL